jgi:Sulfite exporter TauE/SafE
MFPEPLGKKGSVLVTLLLLAAAGGLLLVVVASNASLSPSADPTSPRELSEAVEVEEDDLSPLFPLGTEDYIGFLAAIFALLIAAGGGIGGGGLLVPIFLLVMKFPVKHAVSLSNVTVFGGALGNLVLNAGKTHPLAGRPLIDWNLLAMMEPLTMAGALIGADLTQILPDVLVVILLVLLLGYTTIRTFEKVSVCMVDAYYCPKWFCFSFLSSRNRPTKCTPRKRQ